MGIHITPVFVPENIDPKSDAQVSVYFADAITPLIASGYTKQAIVDGLLLAASAAMHEAFISPKLPHRSTEETVKAVDELAKKLNHVAADELKAITTFNRN